MLKIRLTRLGAKKNPFYRVVVIDSKEARNGTPVATVGWYDPAKKDAPVKLNEEEILHWSSFLTISLAFCSISNIFSNMSFAIFELLPCSASHWLANAMQRQVRTDNQDPTVHLETTICQT